MRRRFLPKNLTMFKLARLPKRDSFQALSLFNSTVNSSSASEGSKINIPQRKERGPTDILRTLSNTVKRDPTAAHYKFHDDPYLIPLSTVGKRTFALAQEAGRKAAKWIVNENQHLFQHKHAEPPIEVFMPKTEYNENSNVEEKTLLQVIGNGRVGDAIVIYDLLIAKEIAISDSTKQALLELVCFTNEEDGIPEELIEERWFGHSARTKSAETIIKTWKDNGRAEALFKNIESPTAATYSTLIQGMTKYGQIERAWHSFQLAKEKQMVLDVGAYNAILGVVNNLKQGSDLRWQLLENILTEMANAKIQPNISTLNSVLTTISVMGGGSAVKHALASLAEFRKLGIEPSLGSYYLLIQTIGRDKNTAFDQHKVLSDILDRLEGQNLVIRHPLDTKFFVRAMELCRFAAQDANLAKRVDDLLHYSDNYNLIGDSYTESIYYRHFFILLCKTETMEQIMESYNLLVPNIYTPEPMVMQELIQAADAVGDMTQIPRFWSDIVAFDQADREQLLALTLDTLVRNEPDPGSPLVESFCKIAEQIWEKIENQPANRVNVISWSGEMLSNVMILATRNNNIELADKVMKILAKEDSYIGEPHIEALCSYMDLCIVNNDFKNALTCLNYCKTTGRAEVITMAKDLRSRLNLTDEESQTISQLVADT